MAHHGDRIGIVGNDVRSVRDLVAAGAGLAVFPCFAGDSDPQLVRVAPPITELRTEQWLAMHHEERHHEPVRTVVDRLADLLNAHAALFRGDEPQP
jgi:DNA-binding transcriptional LysR family regulator